jgi:addiction module HigA family antidote
MVAMKPSPRVPMHPGGSLEDAIHDRGTSAAELALATGLQVAEVKAILDERAPITARVALLLAAYFGTSPEFWMNLQAAYDLDTARAELGDALDLVAALPPAPGSEEPVG